jgi:AcrR family transcriptional regulator
VTPGDAAGARERILATAHELFCRHGVRAVGIDRIVSDSGVAKTTLYRHFRSKDELAIAVLELREHEWSRNWLEAGVRERPPAERLPAIFDLFAEWFRSDGYAGCLFVNTLLEARDPASPVYGAAVGALLRIRAFVVGLAQDVGARDPERFAVEFQQLMFGAIVSADLGDEDAARLAKGQAAALVASATSV